MNLWSLRKRGKALFLIAGFFLFSPAFLSAEDTRALPLDLFLIVDGSVMLNKGKGDALNWINSELIDGILQEGDNFTILSAGTSAQTLYSEKLGAEKDGAKQILQDLDTSAEKADFSGALREAAAKSVSGGGRLSVTMIISGSASSLAPSLGTGADLFRWSKVDEYSGWQLLVVSNGIREKIKLASAAYMSGL